MIAPEISESPNSFPQYFFLEKTTFTSDSSTLIGVYYDIVYSEAVVKLWDSTTGEEIQKSYVDFDPNDEAIGTVEISINPDSSILTWIGRNTDTDIVSITLWDIQTGKTTHAYSLNSLSRDIAVASISSSNSSLIIAKFDGTVDLLDLTTGRTIQSSTIGYVLEVVALHSDGKTLFGVDHNNDTIGIWDTITAELIGVLEGHVSPIDFLAFHLNSAILLSGSRDGMIKLWEPPGREIRTICAI
ncbi:WD domain, G-beta repeat [Leptolyngbya sp. O-77]|nr:WD domain, G-beta repeat [Leptolyngbya sp. O-77]